MSFRSSWAAILVALLAASPALAVQITYYGQPASPQSVAVGLNGVIYYTDYSTGLFGYRLQDGTQGTLKPTGNTPQGIAAGLDGFIWFVDPGLNQVVRYSPTNIFVPFSYFPVTTSNAGVGVITAGPDGNMWFTEYSAGKIGKITPAGTVTEYALPNTAAQPFHITLGSDGALWFTEFAASKIGRITTTGSITEYAYPTASAGGRGITLGADGALWFCENSGHKIGRITTSGTVTEYALPLSIPAEIVAGPGGALWFSDAADKIGRITTSGVVTLYSVDPANGSPSAMVVGPDGAVWFAQGVGAKLGRLVPLIAGDSNGDGVVTAADIFYLINYLFTAGPPPM